MKVEKIYPNINTITQHLIQANLKPIPRPPAEDEGNMSTYKDKGRIIDIRA